MKWFFVFALTFCVTAIVGLGALQFTRDEAKCLETGGRLVGSFVEYECQSTALRQGLLTVDKELIPLPPTTNPTQPTEGN